MRCPNAGSIDFADPCIRTIWSALLPALFVFILCTNTLLPKSVKKHFGSVIPFDETLTRFLTLHEAEALDAPGGEMAYLDDEAAPKGFVQVEVENTVPLWRTVMLSFVSLLETLCWISVACFTLVVKPDQVWDGVGSLLIALTWLYASCRPIVKPSPTPPWDLFVLFTAQLFMGILQMGGILYAKEVYETPLPATAVIVGHVFNLLALLVLLGVVVSMPLAVHSSLVQKRDIVRYHSVLCATSCR